MLVKGRDSGDPLNNMKHETRVSAPEREKKHLNCKNEVCDTWYIVRSNSEHDRQEGEKQSYQPCFKHEICVSPPS